MAYQILIDYETGDSFNSERREGMLNITWQNVDIAKENLVRIKEHYAWYDYMNDNYGQYKYKNKIPQRPAWHDNKHDFSVKLKMDNGGEMDMSAFWCGYFETLYGASIVEEKDSDMSFTTDRW